MGDIIGHLKVFVIKGNNLAIRDFRSSDPYVTLRIGNQTTKTRVIKNCLDPVWNEEFTFSLRDPTEVLKLEVYDRDRFKYDDRMGRTFVSLQPIVAAAKLKRALRLQTGETRLRKVMPDSDNCLMEESFVCCVNGEITQDFRLRLCDVECGNLNIKLMWSEIS